MTVRVLRVSVHRIIVTIPLTIRLMASFNPVFSNHFKIIIIIIKIIDRCIYLNLSKSIQNATVLEVLKPAANGCNLFTLGEGEAVYLGGG